jgi:hypothetical protein
MNEAEQNLEPDSPRHSVRARIGWHEMVCDNCNRTINFTEDTVIYGGPHLDHPFTKGPTFHVGPNYPECAMVAKFYGRRWEFRWRKIKRKKGIK